MRLDVWQSYLSSHPDKNFVEYLLRGIKDGFRIGFRAAAVQLKSRKANMLSVFDHPQVVTEYIKEEVQANTMHRVENALAKNVHCSPFGVIPKKNKPNKWRLILDLSSPDGQSVNDGIDKDLASLTYISVDDVVAVIRRAGKGALLGKMDIKQAYRNVPVSAKDRHLLGMQWDGQVFIDGVLPFGLRSAPLIFTAIADALQWVIQNDGARWIFHYIDDFITVGEPESDKCVANMTRMQRISYELGLPIEEKKTEGPSTCLTFLGIELDTRAMVMRLPEIKLTQLNQALAEWQRKKTVRKRELLSLIGTLSHACKVVRSGRAFLRRLITLSTGAKRLDHFIRLSKCARSDIVWWYTYSKGWNGVSMMSVVNRTSPEFSLTTDASGSWGCGGFSNTQWFSLKWATKAMSLHITVKELIPITIAAGLWGPQWRGQSVKVWCDNEAVVAIINQNSSRDLEAMHLVRCLAFIMAKFDFFLFASHIKGQHNKIADALSRDTVPLFRTLHPQAQLHPMDIPSALLDLLIVEKPDWLSASWTELWSSIFPME